MKNYQDDEGLEQMKYNEMLRELGLLNLGKRRVKETSLWSSAA